MKKRNETNELHFTLVWIGIYIVLNGAAEYVSQMLNTEKSTSA